MMVSMDAQIRAARTLKQAARDLSAACVDSLRIPQDIAPFARFYDHTMLEHDADIEMTVLLGKLS